MTRRRIIVERDQAMEALIAVKLEGAAAYCDDDGSVKVLGELVATTNEPISEYVEVHVIVYSANNEILGREYTNWSKFGIRQSFELELNNEDSSQEPTKVKIYPAHN